MRIAESSQKVKAERDEAQTKLKLALEQLESKDLEIAKITELSQKIIVERDEAQTYFRNALDQLLFALDEMDGLESMIARQDKKIEELIDQSNGRNHIYRKIEDDNGCKREEDEYYNMVPVDSLDIMSIEAWDGKVENAAGRKNKLKHVTEAAVSIKCSF